MVEAYEPLDPYIVYKTTGVYHLQLQKHLRDNEFRANVRRTLLTGKTKYQKAQEHANKLTLAETARGLLGEKAQSGRRFEVGR